MNAIEKELSEEEKNRGIKRKWIPAKDVIKELEEIRNNSKLWYSPKGAGGQDQYAGLPPFLRNIDSLIEKLKS